MCLIKVNLSCRLLMTLLILLINNTEVKAQSSGNRIYRNDHLCHMTHIETCLSNVNKLGESNPSDLITTEKGFERLCRFVVFKSLCFLKFNQIHTQGNGKRGFRVYFKLHNKMWDPYV